MKQYIVKASLEAEIENIESSALCEYKSNKSRYAEGSLDVVHRVKHFLDTLEVKEVDLDALGVLARHLIVCDAHGITPKYSDRELDFLERLTKQ